MQPPSLYFPATHVVVQVCASLAALLRYLPSGQVLSVHGELSVCVEYVPEAHGEQDASTVAVPATNPWPFGHDGVECGLHA